MSPVQTSKAKRAFPAFCLDRGPATAGTRLILAHGAGAGITSPFLAIVADLLEERGLTLTLFEFAYMADRRQGGSKRPPPRAELLTEEYRAVIAALRQKNPRQTFIIGGKSLGGRVASLIADSLYETQEIAGLICLGYPFHPPGDPEKLRIEHLKELRCPALFVQGERDPFGNRLEVEKLALSRRIAFAWASDGDHDLGPRGSSGFTRKGNLQAAADAVAAFVATFPRRVDAADRGT